MRIISNSLLRVKCINVVRNLYTSLRCNGYEGPGKTTVHVLSRTTQTILIKTCAQDGFMLSNEMKVLGPMAIFPKSILYWNVATANDINSASLSLFFVLDPKPDIVIIGLETAYPTMFTNKIRAMFREEEIPVEILPVRSACAAYNIVCEEGRFVGGAFIPPSEATPHKLVKVVQAAKDQLMQSKPPISKS